MFFYHYIIYNLEQINLQPSPVLHFIYFFNAVCLLKWEGISYKIHI
jgi:hypothetical protein